MEQKLQQIEQDFLPQITEAQKNADLANQKLADLNAVKAEKLEAIKKYYEALSLKEQAEIIIANTPSDIKQ